MRYEDRTQLAREQLTEDLFRTIIAYRFCRPSGMGGPGCVIMVAENGRSYQFFGTELDRLNYARGEWGVVFPILRNANGWKVVACKGDRLYFRQDKYPRIMQCIDEAKGKIDRIWEDAAVKVALLDTAKTPEERRNVNRTHELRQPLYRYGDLVRFTYTNGKKEWPCRGRICTVDIYRDGIYDDISKLKASYERVISNPADEHGFQQYDFYLNNPCTKLTIEEFDQDNEIFVEVEPELLWAEFDKESVYGKGPFFLLVTADEWNHDADEWLGIYVSKKQFR